MHAISRTYSGPGARQLAEIIEASKKDVEQLMRSVPGFVSYTMIRTSDGCITITTCKDKAGTDESARLAADWVKKNGKSSGAAPPSITEGPVVIHFG